LQHAKQLGADRLATGHYAAVASDSTGIEERVQLMRPADKAKDQTYFLCQVFVFVSLSIPCWTREKLNFSSCHSQVHQEALLRTTFPLADIPKSQVRQLAVELKVRVFKSHIVFPAISLAPAVAHCSEARQPRHLLYWKARFSLIYFVIHSKSTGALRQ
jgi:hypothetical protein